MNTTALTEKSVRFLHIVFFFVFLQSPLFGRCFRGMKNKFKTKQQRKETRQQDATTEPLSPVTKKQKTRKHRHSIMQTNCLKWKQSTQEKQRKTNT